MGRILIVEDEVDLSRMVEDYLVARGLEVESVYDGATAVRRAFEAPPALIVLDLNLPGLGGMDVARTIRSQIDVPFLIVTARGEEEERLAGFAAGADDYVVKPFSLPELAARVQAILRRTAPAPDRALEDSDAGPVRVGGLTIDPVGHTLIVDGKRRELTPAQFAILNRMATAPGRVWTRAQLLDAFQDHAFEGYERTIDVHVRQIRKAIEVDPSNPERLVTVWGVGYRLERL